MATHNWALHGVPRQDLERLLQLKQLLLPQIEVACTVHPDFKDKPKPLGHEIWFKKDGPASDRFVAQAVLIREGSVEGMFSASSKHDFVGALENLWVLLLTRAGVFAPCSGEVVKTGDEQNDGEKTGGEKT
jgi:hypothetical protein